MRYLLMLVLFLVACQPAANPSTTSSEIIQLGETVYVQQCASCHGVNLEGQLDWKIQNEDGSFRAPPHDDTGHTWHHGDPTLLEAIRLGGARFNDLNIGGTSNMPAFSDILSDEEITAVLTYIKSTWTEENQGWQEEATRRETEVSEP
jgi:mono/diheme cytochrome c family protein